MSTQGCDSANNDWGSTARDYVHIYAVGFRHTHRQESGSRRLLFALCRGQGLCEQPAARRSYHHTGVNKFLLTGTNAAVNYPENISRNQEVVAVFRYRLTKNLTPKIEYRYQQFDSKDYQTSPMTPFMGCVSPTAATEQLYQDARVR